MRKKHVISHQIRRYARRLGKVRSEAHTLGPVLMKAYEKALKAETITFVEWIRRDIDPTLPLARSEWRDHPSYLAADYLRRIQFYTQHRVAVARDDKKAIRLLIHELTERLAGG